MTNPKSNDSEMKWKYRKFKNFFELCSPEFNSLIKTLMPLIRHGGDSIPLDTPSESLESFTHLLSGWKQAQKIIAEELIRRLSLIEHLEKEKKLAHSEKDYEKKKKCIGDIQIIKLEIRILRRCIDSIVWTILSNEHSSIRRLPINGTPDNLSEFNINDSMRVADEINRDPMAIAIITDITTFIHTGDLLSLIPDQGVSLIEIKSGKKNMEFSKAAAFSMKSECPHFDDEYTKTFDKNDLKHYQRTKRQLERAKNVIEAINTGQGFDNYHQSSVRIHDRNFRPYFYTDNIIKLWYEIYNGKSWAITDINECLFIGAYNNASMGFCGFNGWMEVSKISGTIFNILDSFSDCLSRPFFSLNLPDKLLLDIISGDLIIVLCFDHKRFFERAKRKHPELYSTLDFPSTTSDTKSMLSINGKGIAFKVDGMDNFIANGYETRIIFDQHHPDNLIDWSYRMSDLKKEHDKQKRIVKNKAKKKIVQARKRSRK
ncbi:hypothetical protein [Raoultella ornithinolytica]|uniref:hypothetical protein n=1 Tax=Raoultella ornithinolytica TaxID=54291 RepID=UPI00064EA002|nr:hypothetical protein [Raoultella ornithinolytica]